MMGVEKISAGAWANTTLAMIGPLPPGVRAEALALSIVKQGMPQVLNGTAERRAELSEAMIELIKEMHIDRAEFRDELRHAFRQQFRCSLEDIYAENRGLKTAGKPSRGAPRRPPPSRDRRDEARDEADDDLAERTAQEARFDGDLGIDGLGKR